MKEASHTFQSGKEAEKSTYERRKIIYDELIKRHELKNHAYVREEILKKEYEIDISERTFKSDIQRMRMELEKHKVRLVYGKRMITLRNTRESDLGFMELPDESPATKEEWQYFYTDFEGNETDKFSFTSAIHNDEMNALIHIMAMVSSFPKLEEKDTVMKLLERMGLKAGILHPEEIKNYVKLDFVPDLTGVNHLGILLQYTIQKNVIEIDYKPYNDDPYQVVVHPYFLQEYNNRWFLWGLRTNLPEKPNGVIHTYPLDRIKNITLLPLEKFNENRRVDPHTYLKDIIGNRLELNKEVQDIVFKIKNHRAPYLETKKIHASQILIEKDDEWTTFRITIIPNLELHSIFRSYGDDCILITQNIPFEPRQD